MNIKTFFIDLDGTLLDQKQGSFYHISKANIDAIAQANRQKKIIVISSGRPLAMVLKMTRLLNLEYLIARNGAFVANKKGEILRHEFIENKLAHQLLEVVRKKHLSAHINDQKFVYGLNPFVSFISRWYDSKNVSWKHFVKPEKYNKITLVGLPKFQMHRIATQLKQNFKNLSIASIGWTIEITSLNANKGQASLWLLKHLKIDPDAAMHIGDSENDISAFKALGHSCVLKNAPKRLYKYAKQVGPDFKNGGISQILKKHL